MKIVSLSAIFLTKSFEIAQTQYLGLADMRLTTDLYEKIIDGAMADHCHKMNPRIATREEYAALLGESMKI